MTSLKFSRWRPLTSRINFRFQFDSVIRRSGSLSIPNFVKISQYRAQGWAITITGLGKRTAAILKFYFRFRLIWSTSRQQHLILHRHTKYRMNWTMGGVLMTSLKFSRWRPLTSRITFRFQYGRAHVLRRSGSLIPRLHDTSGCQTGLTTGLIQTGLTTVLNEQPLVVQPVVKPGLTTLLNEQLFVQPVVKPRCTTSLTAGCIHDTAGCHTGCQTGLPTGWMFVYTIQPVVKPVDNRLCRVNGAYVYPTS